MTRRSTTFLLVSILLGAAGLIVWYNGAAELSVPPAGTGGADGADGAAGQGAGGAVDRPVDDPGVVVAGVEVQVELTVRARVVGPPRARVEVRRGDRGLSASVRSLGGVDAEVRSVGAATAPWPDPARRAGWSLVRVEAGPLVLHRRVRVAATGADAVLELGASTTLRGRVKAADGAPVAGAVVWCGGALDDQVVTDADGVFAAQVTGSDGIPVVVRKDGKAWSGRFVDWRFDDGSELLFQLEDECVLRVQALAAVGDDRPLDGASAFVLPGADASTAQLQFPFFAQELFADQRVDERGAATVRGLPRGVTVAAGLRGPRLLRTGAATVRLEGAHADAMVELETAARIVAGRVVDDAGEPIAGARVLYAPAAARRGQVADRWLVGDGLELPGAAAAWTDARGAFALAVGGDAAPRLFVDTGAAGIEWRSTAATADLVLIVPRWRGPAASLRLPDDGVGWRWAGGQLRDDGATLRPAGDDARTLPLPQPMVADLAVAVRAAAGDWSSPRVLNAQALVGEFAVPAELLVR